LLQTISEAYDPHDVSDVTQLLDAVEKGEPRAAEELLPLVYEELRQLATARMANENPGQTLQPTALVHEAWLRLLGPEGTQLSWQGRGHFFAAAAEAMRRILIDRARHRNRVRHGKGKQRINLENVDVAVTTDDQGLLAVDEALGKLTAEDPQAGELIKLRFFAGLNMAEIAKAMEMSERSAHRTWAFARAWLYQEISSRSGDEKP